jgi:hypothetical protein
MSVIYMEEHVDFLQLCSFERKKSKIFTVFKPFHSIACKNKADLY